MSQRTAFVHTPTLPHRSRASWNAQDSPSRQLLTDLEKELERLQSHVADVHKIHLLDRVAQRKGNDEHDARIAEEQLAGLDRVLLQQEAVRKDAEAELEAWHRKVEEEEAQRRREVEERRRREEEARREAERKKREREEAERQAQRRAAEEKAKAEAARLEAEEKAEQTAKADAERKARQEREASAQRDAAAQAKAEQEQAAKQKVKAAQAIQAAQQGVPPSDPQQESIHERYLQIHQNLKKFRKPFWEQCRKDPNVKSKVGEIRRLIRKSVAQLVDLRGNTKVLPMEQELQLTAAARKAREAPPSNAEATRDVKKALSESLKIPTTTVDVRDYIAFPSPSITNDPSPTVPALLIYSLNIFSKALVSQLATEASVVIARAEPTGVLAAQIFPLPDYCFKGQHSLIDIFLAKLHLVCPPLFGIHGLESSVPGRTRLGWWKDADQFIPSARHHDRMTGFAAGFAALSLRNFSKSRLRNPYPPHHFWATLADILNLAPEAVQATHLTILRGLINGQSVERFVLFYEEAAVAVLRRTVTQFVERLPEGTRKLPQAGLVRDLAEMLRREVKLGVV